MDTGAKEKKQADADTYSNSFSAKPTSLSAAWYHCLYDLLLFW